MKNFSKQTVLFQSPHGLQPGLETIGLAWLPPHAHHQQVQGFPTVLVDDGPASNTHQNTKHNQTTQMVQQSRLVAREGNGLVGFVGRLWLPKLRLR
jgi:hypothetical protein